MVSNAASSWIGSPHSSHSGGVSGRLASSIVARTSTNGTSAMIAGEKVGREIGDGAHEQAAGAAALSHDPPWAGKALGDQESRRGEEIAKSVRLLVELAVLVPAPAFVRAAAHMGDREHEAAVDEREPVGRKTRLGRITVGAVAGDEKRRRSVEPHAPLVKQRHRHALAVIGWGEDQTRDISLRIEAARHRLPLDEGRDAG